MQLITVQEALHGACLIGKKTTAPPQVGWAASWAFCSFISAKGIVYLF